MIGREAREDANDVRDDNRGVELDEASERRDWDESSSLSPDESVDS
jgi:hypothetical protein